MDYKFINEILKNLDNLKSNKEITFIEKRNKQTYSESDSEWDEYYRVNKENNLFLKLSWYSNSYNGNELIKGIEFVKAKEVQKIEYINID